MSDLSPELKQQVSYIATEISKCIINILGVEDFMTFRKQGRIALTDKRLRRLEAWEKRTGLTLG